MAKTYSFQDTDVTIYHPNVGNFVLTGEGIGSVSVNMANDRTAHDTSADGVVMISKIKTRSGTMSMAVQQTSEINKWLMNWSNYLEIAPASEWAGTVLVIRSRSTGDYIIATGVSPQKMADRSYQAQGQSVTWNLMSSDIQQAAL